MPHVGGEPGQEGLDVGPLAVPLDEPVHGEGVAEIVDPNVERTVAGLGDADCLAGPSEGVVHSIRREESSPARGKQRRIIGGPGSCLAFPEEAFQDGRQARADRNDPRLEELGVPDREEPSLEVQISSPEPEGLARAQSERVDREKEIA